MFLFYTKTTQNTSASAYICARTTAFYVKSPSATQTLPHLSLILTFVFDIILKKEQNYGI